MFADKVIVISGASKGIGREISIALGRQGAHLVLLARGEESLYETQEQIRKECPASSISIHPCNITDFPKVQGIIASVLKNFGRVDGCISNAGYAYPQYFQETPFEEFEKQVYTNYLGAVNLIQSCYRQMNRGGFVAFTSSVLGYLGCFGYTSYSPTKFAILGFAECLRQELIFDGISVTVLCPPDTLTPGYAQENLTKPRETKLLSGSTKQMRPEEVAQIFVKGLAKRKFLINCNIESRLLYRFKLCAPEMFYRIISSRLSKIRQSDDS